MKSATKPIIKDCYQVTDPLDRDALQQWAESISDEFHIRFFLSNQGCLVHTVQGSVYAKPGDWIVKEQIAFSVIPDQNFQDRYFLVQEEEVKEGLNHAYNNRCNRLGLCHLRFLNRILVSSSLQEENSDT